MFPTVCITVVMPERREKEKSKCVFVQGFYKLRSGPKRCNGLAPCLLIQALKTVGIIEADALSALFSSRGSQGLLSLTVTEAEPVLCVNFSERRVCRKLACPSVSFGTIACW